MILKEVFQVFWSISDSLQKRRTKEAGDFDCIQMKLGVSMAVLELLDKIIVIGSFHPDIMLHSIKLILKMIAKM